MKAQTKSRLKMLSVFVIFFIPLIASYVLYYGMSDVMRGGVTNQGELLSPVQPLPSIPLRGAEGTVSSADVLQEQWTMLQVAPERCGPACEKGLRETRQVWALLHDERPRVQRVLLVGGERPSFPRQPYLKVYSGDLSPLVDVIKAEDAHEAGTIYLVDPHGNWVLYYPPEDEGDGLFDDIRHLLRLSTIG